MKLVPGLAIADAILVERAVVLKDEVNRTSVAALQRIAENAGRLLDDAHVRNNVDDAVEPVAHCVIHSEGERRQRLAATGRYGECEHALRFRCALPYMGEHLRAQVVHVTTLSVRLEVLEMRIESARQLSEVWVVPTHRRCPVQTAVIRVGVQIVRIHERGEHHADKECSTETGRVLVARLEAGRNQRYWQCDLPLPNRIRHRNRPAQALLQSGDPLTVHAIGESRVVPCNAERQHLPKQISVPVDCKPGTRCRVVEPPRTAFQPRPKLVGVLTEVMQQPGHPTELVKTDGLEKRSRAVRSGFKVYREPLPLLPVFRSAMSVVQRAIHDASSFRSLHPWTRRHSALAHKLLES